MGKAKTVCGKKKMVTNSKQVSTVRLNQNVECSCSWILAANFLVVWRPNQRITKDIVSIKGDKAEKAGDFTLNSHIFFNYIFLKHYIFCILLSDTKICL